MEANHIEMAQSCLAAAHDGSLDFPEIVRRLVDAGFEGYAVDYRAGRQYFYRPDGQSLDLDMPRSAGAVAAHLDAEAMARLVRWARANDPRYSYSAFNAQAKQSGCAGYLVSFPGRRVVYYGRTAETHVEHFPK